MMSKFTLASRCLLMLSYLSSIALLSIFWAEEAQNKLLPIVSAASFLIFYAMASFVSRKAGITKSAYWGNWFFALLGGFYMTAIFGFLALSISLIGTPVVIYYFISLLVIAFGIFRIKFGSSEIHQPETGKPTHGE